MVSHSNPGGRRKLTRPLMPLGALQVLHYHSLEVMAEGVLMPDCLQLMKAWPTHPTGSGSWASFVGKVAYDVAVPSFCGTTIGLKQLLFETRQDYTERLQKSHVGFEVASGSELVLGQALLAKCVD